MTITCTLNYLLRMGMH
uniref:Uncharacterized protein n=1 Tax=Arundo donax TaxID=35708 RepID=A0A0A9FNF7_ARUDO